MVEKYTGSYGIPNHSIECSLFMKEDQVRGADRFGNWFCFEIYAIDHQYVLIYILVTASVDGKSSIQIKLSVKEVTLEEISRHYS